VQARPAPILTALLIVAGCDQSSFTQPGGPALSRVNSTHIIRAAFVNYPPSFIVDRATGAKTGIMADVMYSVAKSLGLKVEYTRETGWANMVNLVNSGRVDVVVSGIWPSGPRALHALFSRAVYYSPVYAYARGSDHRFENDLARADTSSIRIATIKGEISAGIAAADFPRASTLNLPRHTNPDHLLAQLLAGKADLTFMSATIAEAYLDRNPGRIRRVRGGPPMRVFANTFLFAEADYGLRDAIDATITEQENEGAVQAIVRRYDAKGDATILPSVPTSP
jgi:ABC-type amino acid transport substrate-binding protein